MLLGRCVRLAWHRVPVLDRTRDRAHGRVELRTLASSTPSQAPPGSPTCAGHWAIENGLHWCGM
jgi:hypothetical protein